MIWSVTDDAGDFLAEAGDFLRTAAAENTVVLTVAADVRARGAGAFGGAETLFGWYRSIGGPVSGVFLHTHGNPLHLGVMPVEAIGPLADSPALAERKVASVNTDERAVAAVVAAWRDRAGASLRVQDRERLYRLGTLTPLERQPPGRARPATAADRDLLVAWHLAFNEEAGQGGDSSARVDDRLSYGGLYLWYVDDTPVCMVGHSRVVSGMARIGPVYSPPEHRRRGYAGALTVMASQATRDGGATTTVLFTDLANPTSNRIYQRLGYVPVADRVLLGLDPPTA
ncbi:hypothetical protein ACG83_32940 [Frankia sp. R43]|uniref:GNAT family N-acetyltransferase n=1 Tax=Frankia sp. R43 TaxID=269536 RepID=UPI0006CA43C9|nr:GNAT family N-acetyltransferase [Frankia sp. R43]KPM51654.1 hypothetical protein ACG83_32940 [Frankia sp. R43]